ncbi:TetR/AcrR family transcriptional regulator [Streptomyces griseofuscus]|uniref:TetR/AcrR family transcriptional regulator n=1 Tax=Streptomyces griseofuscus TaxID=146922 RepID=UPI0033C24E37
MARQTAEQRRDAVLRSAVTEFGRFGEDGASTMAISQGAGISQSYLFRLFPSKRALFLAAVERAFDETEAALRGGASGSSTLDELRQRYAELLSGTGRDLLYLQLHVYARSLEDPECQEIGRRGFLRLSRAVAELTQAPAGQVLNLFAHATLWSVLAVLGLPLPPGRET